MAGDSIETKFESKNCEILEPPNRLKKKVGDARGFSTESLKKAEAAIREMGSEYINNVIYDVRDLKKHFEDFVKASGQKRHLALKKVNWHAHEIKGQGGTFGYPFLSKVARSLCFYIYKLEDRNAFDELALEIMRAHISALMVIADKRMRGDGGEMGVLVAEGLEVAVKKHITRDKKFMNSNVIEYLQKLQEHMEKSSD